MRAVQSSRAQPLSLPPQGLCSAVSLQTALPGKSLGTHPGAQARLSSSPLGLDAESLPQTEDRAFWVPWAVSPSACCCPHHVPVRVGGWGL